MFALTYKKIDTTLIMDYKEDIIRTDVRKNEGTMRSEVASRAARHKVRKSPAAKVIPLHPEAQSAPKAVDPVAAYIAAWNPKTLSKKEWEPIASVVRAMITKTKPNNKQAAAKRLRVLTRLVAIQHKKGHRIDDPAALLNEETLIKVHGQGSPGDLLPNSRATDLYLLRVIRKALLPEIYDKPVAVAVGSKRTTPFYSDEEIIALLQWARGGRIALSKRVHVQLLLGIAAGIDGHEIPYLRGRDLLCTPWGLVINAPGVNRMPNRGPRLAPVLGEYEEELATLMMRIGDNPILGNSPTGSVRKSSDYQISSAGVPNFNSLHARSNWIRTLIAGRVSYLAMQHGGTGAGSDSALKNLSKGLALPFRQVVQELRLDNREFHPERYSALTQWSAKQ